jgi:hypothetical protein
VENNIRRNQTTKARPLRKEKTKNQPLTEVTFS